MRGSHVSQFTTTIVPHQPLARAAIRVGRLSVAVFAYVMLGACAAKPLMPYSADTPPLVLVPTPYAGIQDQRARFREIFCAVLEARARDIPDYQPCDEALTRVGAESAGTGRPVALGPSSRRLVAAVVPGGTLLGYLNADHWALAVPCARAHSTIASVLVTRNAYPREALLEAILRFVEEDLESPQR